MHPFVISLVRPYQSTLTCIGVLPGREVDDTNGKWEGDYLVMSYLKEDSDRTEYVCGVGICEYGYLLCIVLYS